MPTRRSRRSAALDYRRKDRRKIAVTIMQVIVLLLLAGLLIRALFDIKSYQEPDKTEWDSRDGFIAVSYFGIGRREAEDQFGRRKVDEQLRALYERGYRTISQQDIVDFYRSGKPLPEKALFLSFEDGRNDSALFASPMLERYNYKATALSYANKMGSKEGKFLQPKELLKMTKKGFWELGSNGYRLAYINIVDENGKFLGARNPGEFPEQRTARYYTHYLLDFIRDENGVPVENRSEMEARIDEDYDLMESVYKKMLGFVPRAYMIMHANSMYGRMNPLVERINDARIRQLFDMHFNREGHAMNKPEDSLYNLTRVQPAPHWETNHLLMQLRHDTGGDLPFVTGDGEEAGNWLVESGAAEWSGEKIALTSPPGEAGLMLLGDSGNWADIRLSVKLAGHSSGEQTVYLRYGKGGDSFVRFRLRKGELVVEQKAAGAAAERLLAARLGDGGARGARLNIALVGDRLDAALEGEPLLLQERVNDSIRAGFVALAAEADTRDVRWNEHDEQDEIYDGVFEAITVRRSEVEGTKEDLLYSNQLSGLRRLLGWINSAYHGAVDWAIETF